MAFDSRILLFRMQIVPTTLSILHSVRVLVLSSFFRILGSRTVTVFAKILPATDLQKKFGTRRNCLRIEALGIADPVFPFYHRLPRIIGGIMKQKSATPRLFYCHLTTVTVSFA